MFDNRRDAVRSGRSKVQRGVGKTYVCARPSVWKDKLKKRKKGKKKKKRESTKLMAQNPAGQRAVQSDKAFCTFYGSLKCQICRNKAFTLC